MERQTSHHSQSQSSSSNRNSKDKISISIPKPSLPSIQTIILSLLVIVGLLQTIQLFGLQQNIATAQINGATKSSSGSVSAPASGSSASLPEMVGGC